MADVTDVKAQKIKLANSRKKFKELQEMKKKRDMSDQGQTTTAVPGEKIKPNRDSLPINEVPLPTNEVPLQTNEVPLQTNQHVSNKDQINLVNTDNKLPNYFSGNLNYTNHEQPVMFFDNFLNNETHNHPLDQPTNVFNYVNSSSPQTTFLHNMVSDIVHTPNKVVHSLDNYSLFSSENQPSFVAETQQIIHPNQEGVSLDDPEIKQNEILELQKQTEINTAVQNRQDLIDYLQGNNDHREIQDHSVFTNDSSNLNMEHSSNQSSVESLKQLSSQIAQIIEPEYVQYSSPITDLEKRNLELAALLEQEKLKTEQQKAYINDLESKIANIESERNINDEHSNIQMTNVISKMNEELQSHIQTVGVLVAEKTELSASLSQLEITCKQKNSECEELQARLKASRSRVADLERELNVLKSDQFKFESIEKQQIEITSKYRKECDDLKEQKEELVQDLLEVREKLKNSLDENLTLQQHLKETSSKLSLAELKIQQITNGEQDAASEQSSSLTQEKLELEKQISNLNSMLKTITKERDESNIQYQQYAQQLNAQITNLSNRIQQLQQENENLSLQEQNRVKHISELERQLQNLQNQQVAFATTRSVGDGNLKLELENTRELCIQLQIEKTAMEENLTKTFNEKEMLMKELAAKNESLSQLETMIEQLQGNQPDSVKLLATMESDKVAAARAVQQNKELKEQMESMQEVFMKLDNDKVDLTEKLSVEQTCNKELLEKLQRVELQVQRLTDAIEIKDRELSSLRDTTTELSKQVLQHEQLADRLRHYEANDNSSHVLQFELQEAKKIIEKLTNDINIIKNEENYRSSEKLPNDKPIEDLQTDLSSEELQKEYQQDENEDKADYSSEYGDNNNVHNKTLDERLLDKESAMKHLEEKFKKTMQEIADLTDEKQRLEHLVLQLQGETETIGEYVALYQHQRMVLNQKAIEKDQQLKQLANDREQIKSKLENLSELINKLVIDKGQVPEEFLQEHTNLNNACDKYLEDHAKHGQEINKTHDINHTNNIENGKSEIAEQIIDLLSDIKSSNLIQSAEDVHHCAWCSGKLITV